MANLRTLFSPQRTALSERKSFTPDLSKVIGGRRASTGPGATAEPDYIPRRIVGPPEVFKEEAPAPTPMMTQEDTAISEGRELPQGGPKSLGLWANDFLKGLVETMVGVFTGSVIGVGWGVKGMYSASRSAKNAEERAERESAFGSASYGAEGLGQVERMSGPASEQGIGGYAAPAGLGGSYGITGAELPGNRDRAEPAETPDKGDTWGGF